MKRRDFIQLSSFAAAAVSFPLLHSCNQSESAIADPLFLSRLFDKKTIREAGKAYIKKTPDENSANKLIELISDGSSISRSSNEKNIQKYIYDRVKQDFETGRTVSVQGWVLSVTEARQCALFSLVNT